MTQTQLLDRSNLRFPLSYTLKVIMDATLSDQENEAGLSRVLSDLSIPFAIKNQRLSTSGFYMTYSIMVTINTYETMRSLYIKLKNVPGLKFAV